MTNIRIGAGDRFAPGDSVPLPGLYECVPSCGHDWTAATDGQLFPPMAEGCVASHWRLKEPDTALSKTEQVEAVAAKQIVSQNIADRTPG